MSMQAKIDALLLCGITLREGDATGLGNGGFEAGRDDWTAVLSLMAPHCVNLAFFDTECVDGAGAYVSIAESLQDMAQGSLPLSDITDEVDHDAGVAWLAFSCAGTSVHMDLEVESDWVDPAVFTRFTELLAEQDPDKIFIHHPNGQAFFVACVTRAQYEKLRLINPEFEPLQ
jgi:hypothetical protein